MLLGPDDLPLRGDQEELGGPARQVPGQVGPVQQVHPPGGPSRCGDVPLLVGDRDKGHVQRIGQGRALGLPGQKAGHIGALHRPGAGAGPHGGDVPEKPPLLQLVEQARAGA